MLQCDPAIPLVGIYAGETFMAALFIIVPNWKQPKCSSVDEWINKLWYVHTMNYYSTIEEEQNTDTHNLDESQRH